MKLPDIKPENPNFSSGPCSKRPNWSINNLEGALLGRSHRTPKCKDKLKEVITKSKSILGLPDDYHVGIMPGSDTGALEAAMWCLLGNRGVDILAWENFGRDWILVYPAHTPHSDHRTAYHRQSHVCIRDEHQPVRKFTKSLPIQGIFPTRNLLVR